MRSGDAQLSKVKASTLAETWTIRPRKPGSPPATNNIPGVAQRQSRVMTARRIETGHPGQHRSPPGLSMRHPSADGRNGGNSCGQPGTVRRRFGMPCRWASVLVGGWLRSSHPLKSRAKACSDTYRSEGHQSAGKIDSVAREKRPQRQSWVPLVTHSAQWQQGGFATR